MPEPALQTLLHATECLERDGVASSYPFADDAREVRRMLAALIGAGVGEIALTRNATDGINLGLAGLSWRAGDEIITTTEEHEAVWQPLLHLQQTAGVRVHRMEPLPEPDDMLRQLNRLRSDRLRLVVFSHVSCETGVRVEPQSICRWAREHGALSLVDVAQSCGAVPVSVESMGCDMLAGNGHKWLHGPKGTGFFYARGILMSKLVPRHVGAGSFQSAALETGTGLLWETGERFEYGTRPYALMAGWKSSLEWMAGLGAANVTEHVLAMSGRLMEALGRLPYVRVLTPSGSDQRAGMVSFAVDGRDAGSLGQGLWQKHTVVTRHVPRKNAVRVSAAHFTSHADVEKLETALKDILESGN